MIKKEETKPDPKKVLELREKTSCSILECRQALIEANNDIELAKRILVRNNPMRFGIMDQKT